MSTLSHTNRGKQPYQWEDKSLRDFYVQDFSADFLKRRRVVLRFLLGIKTTQQNNKISNLYYLFLCK